MNRFYGIVFLLVACDGPDPEAVLVEFCAEHPEYQACETKSLEDQIIEFCLANPDHALCEMSEGAEPSDRMPEAGSGAHLVGGGSWDDGERTSYRFETDEPLCLIRVSSGGEPRFEVVMGESEPRAVLFLLLRGEPRLGRIEQPAGATDPFVIGLSVAIGDRSMETPPIPIAVRALEFSEFGAGSASGFFSASDLCAVGVETSTCTGEIIGAFECVPSFFPGDDASNDEETAGG